MTIEKVHFEYGFCETLHYNSLNFVLYQSDGLGQPYIKQKMTCTACKDGRCEKAETCEILIKAPESFEYSDWHLKDLNDLK